MPVTYPVSPKNVDESVIQPSPAFKQEVFKVLWSIAFFVCTYVLLMCAALLLAALCGYGGIMLIAVFPKLVTIMIGLGLVGLGLMVIYFLLKFLFRSNKVDRTHLIEVSKEDQPELFEFIAKLTAETQAPSPRRIYLSSDVNASVFYDSSFLSMFLPVRKNLQIGLGLVNSVNLSEFKAILAHEFGHFSQRSMKLGSYVYNMNKVIYNMLYENDSYERALESWASVSGYFQFFAALTAGVVRGIQWILQRVYGVVNKNYMSLSRQMEFHADAVAASVAGGNHLVTSLRRLELADFSYNYLFQYYNRLVRENLKSDNIYPQHTIVMHRFAEDNQVPIVDNLPAVTADSLAQTNTSRVNIKDQWASHPTTDDREKHLNQLNIFTERMTVSAWSIFRNVEELQRQVTEHIYTPVQFAAAPATLPLTEFRTRFFDDVEKYSLDKRYKGFFNSRNITSFDPETEAWRATNNQYKTLDDILTPETVALPRLIEGIKGDIHLLQMIKSGLIQVEDYEFDGNKYKKQHVDELVANLEGELKKNEQNLSDTDKNVFSFFAKHANGKTDMLIEAYKRSKKISQESDTDTQNYVSIMQNLEKLGAGQLTETDVHVIVGSIKTTETGVKERIQAILSDGDSSAIFSVDDKTVLDKYTAKKMDYFRSSVFIHDELNLLQESLSIFQNAVTDRNFKAKKDLLELQLQLLNT